MEDKDTLEQCLFDGVRFLESLTRHYGADRGMEVWEAMGDAMGRGIKGKIFFAMLTGQSGSRVRMSRSGSVTTPVAVIKAIRVATGMSLKEAKDLWDCTASQSSVNVDCKDLAAARELRAELRANGMYTN